MEKNNSHLKNLFLAFIGGSTMTYERGQDMVNEMIEKGKVSVKEGKELTEDLKRTLRRDELAEANADPEQEVELMRQLLNMRQDLDHLMAKVEGLEKQVGMAPSNQDEEDAEL